MLTSFITKAILVSDGLAPRKQYSSCRGSLRVFGNPGKDQATRQGRSHLGEQPRPSGMASNVSSRLSTVCQISLDSTWWLLRFGEYGELSCAPRIGTVSEHERPRPKWTADNCDPEPSLAVWYGHHRTQQYGHGLIQICSASWTEHISTCLAVASTCLLYLHPRTPSHYSTKPSE